MAWSEETDEYAVTCDTTSARSGQTISLPLEIERIIAGPGAPELRPLLFRCDPARAGTLKGDKPESREERDAVTIVGHLADLTTSGTDQSRAMATFDLPADTEGNFQLLLERVGEPERGQFVVVGVQSANGIFTITR